MSKQPSASWFYDEPPKGEAFPTMTVGSKQQGNALHRQQLASQNLNRMRKSELNITKKNIRNIARNTERYAGLPRGSVTGRITGKKEVVLEAEHPSIEGWGGEEPVLTHLTWHKPRTNYTNSPAGQIHIKTEEYTPHGMSLLHQARVVPTYPNRTRGTLNRPVLNTLVTPKGSNLPPGYPKEHHGATVASSMAKALTSYTRRGGKSKKKAKKSRRHTKKV